MTALQRRQQLGRIHAAAKALALDDQHYRDMLDSFTGLRSCAGMDDRQVNHVLDWLNWFSGRRPRRPAGFPGCVHSSKAGMVRLCYAVADIIPPGYEHTPLRSQTWQHRQTGTHHQTFEEFDEEQLWRLIEGLKMIFRRQGQRGTEDLSDHDLDSTRQDQVSGANRGQLSFIDGDQPAGSPSVRAGATPFETPF